MSLDTPHGVVLFENHALSLPNHIGLSIRPSNAAVLWSTCLRQHTMVRPLAFRQELTTTFLLDTPSHFLIFRPALV
jgi:hypothetical protein